MKNSRPTHSIQGMINPPILFNFNLCCRGNKKESQCFAVSVADDVVDVIFVVDEVDDSDSVDNDLPPLESASTIWEAFLLA